MIANKEIKDTIYWLELLRAKDDINEDEFDSINLDAVELIKILTSIIRNTYSNLVVSC